MRGRSLQKKKSNIKDKHRENRWMNFRKYDSMKTGLTNLFFNNWKTQTKSEKNIQNLGKGFNSYHRIPEILSRETIGTKIKELSQSSFYTKDHTEESIKLRHTPLVSQKRNWGNKCPWKKINVLTGDQFPIKKIVPYALARTHSPLWSGKSQNNLLNLNTFVGLLKFARK